jgi:aminopeptidase N
MSERNFHFTYCQAKQGIPFSKPEEVSTYTFIIKSSCLSQEFFIFIRLYLMNPARLLLAALLLLMSCQSKKNEQTKSEAMITHDPHSFSQPNDALVKHLSLNLNVDFQKQQLRGFATWNIENKTGTNKIIFDTRDLTIEKVMLDENENAVFQLGDSTPFLGRPLIITCKPSTKKITIYYSTSPVAAALQWLEPEQTAGKIFPFLFTQSQAILARTWIPCMDSPGIRFTYNATITVPEGMMAVMSAENPQQSSPDNVYHFKMDQPVPSYLMAMAAGHLSFHAFDHRTGVYAEPVTLDACKYEFEDLPKMVSAAEQLYGPYT